MNKSEEEQIINFEYTRWSMDVSRFPGGKISWESFNAGWAIARDYFSPTNDSPDEPTNEIPTTFKKELENIINKYSRENNSDTPDFILASYMEKALQAFEETVRMRQEWCDHLSPRDSY